MKESQDDRKIRSLFDIGLILKAIFSAFEIAGGIAVLFVSRQFVLHVADLVTQGEYTRDTDDVVATTIRNAAHSFAVHTHYLLAGYLLLRGIVKVVLVISILRGVSIAYLLFIAVLGIFGSYEIYRAITTHNILLGAVAVYDFVLLLLTAYEYKVRYSRA